MVTLKKDVWLCASGFNRGALVDSDGFQIEGMTKDFFDNGTEYEDNEKEAEQYCDMHDLCFMGNFIEIMATERI